MGRLCQLREAWFVADRSLIFLGPDGADCAQPRFDVTACARFFDATQGRPDSRGVQGAISDRSFFFGGCDVCSTLWQSFPVRPPDLAASPVQGVPAPLCSTYPEAASSTRPWCMSAAKIANMSLSHATVKTSQACADSMITRTHRTEGSHPGAHRTPVLGLRVLLVFLVFLLHSCLLRSGDPWSASSITSLAPWTMVDGSSCYSMYVLQFCSDGSGCATYCGDTSTCSCGEYVCKHVRFRG